MNPEPSRIPAHRVLDDVLQATRTVLANHPLPLDLRSEFQSWKALDALLSAGAPEFLIRTRTCDLATRSFSLEIASEAVHKTDSLTQVLQRWALLVNSHVTASITCLPSDDSPQVSPVVITIPRLPIEVVLPQFISERWGLTLSGSAGFVSRSLASEQITTLFGDDILSRRQTLAGPCEQRLRTVIDETNELISPKLTVSIGVAEISIANAPACITHDWFSRFIENIARVGNSSNAPRCVVRLIPSPSAVELAILETLPQQVPWEIGFDHEHARVRITFDATPPVEPDTLRREVLSRSGYLTEIAFASFVDQSRILFDSPPLPNAQFAIGSLDASAERASRTVSGLGVTVTQRGNYILITTPTTQVPRFYAAALRTRFGIDDSIGVRLLAPERASPQPDPSIVLRHWLETIPSSSFRVSHTGGSIEVTYTTPARSERLVHSRCLAEAVNTLQSLFPEITIRHERIIDQRFISNCVTKAVAHRGHFVPFRAHYDTTAETVELYIDALSERERNVLSDELDLSVNHHRLHDYFPPTQTTLFYTPQHLSSPTLIDETTIVRELRSRLPSDLLIETITTFGNIALVVHNRHHLPQPYRQLLLAALDEFPIQVYLDRSHGRPIEATEASNLTFAVRSAPPFLVVTSATFRSEALQIRSVGMHGPELGREIVRWEGELSKTLSTRVVVDRAAQPTPKLCEALRSPDFNLYQYKNRHFPNPPQQTPSGGWRLGLLSERTVHVDHDVIALDSGGTRFRESAFTAVPIDEHTIRIGIHTIDPDYLVEPDSAAATFYLQHPFPISKGDSSLPSLSSTQAKSKAAGLGVGVPRPTVTVWVSFDRETGTLSDSSIELTVTTLSRVVDFDRKQSVATECRIADSPLYLLLEALPTLRSGRLSAGNVSVPYGGSPAHALVYELTLLTNQTLARILASHNVPFIYFTTRPPSETAFRKLQALTEAERVPQPAGNPEEEPCRTLLAAAIAHFPADRVRTLNSLSGQGSLYETTPQINWTTNSFYGQFGTPGRSAVAYLNLRQAKALCLNEDGSGELYTSIDILAAVAERANRAQATKRSASADLAFLEELERSSALVGTPLQAELIRITDGDVYLWLPERRMVVLLDTNNASISHGTVTMQDSKGSLHRIRLNQRFTVKATKLSLRNGMPLVVPLGVC